MPPKKKRTKSLKEEFTGRTAKFPKGRVRTVKEALLGSLSPLDLQRRGKKSVLQTTAEKLSSKKKKKN